MTPRTTAYQAPPSMGFSRQEYWSGVPFSFISLHSFGSYLCPSEKFCNILHKTLVVQLLSHVQLFVISWSAAHLASLSFTLSQSLLKLMSIESVMPSNHFILCRPFLLLPSIFPSIRVFSNEQSLCIRRSKYWSFSVSPSNEYSGLISFRMTRLISLQSKDSQESSPTPQFKSINSLALSLLYGPTLTSTHDSWKCMSGFDYTNLCWQSDTSAF